MLPLVVLGSLTWLGTLLLLGAIRRKRRASSSPRERLALGIGGGLLTVLGLTVWLWTMAVVQRLAVTGGD